jgi:hypothetical protein
MMTTFVNNQGAKAQLDSVEQPYAFEKSDSINRFGPACEFGTDYLIHFQTASTRHCQSPKQKAQPSLESGF